MKESEISRIDTQKKDLETVELEIGVIMCKDESD